MFRVQGRGEHTRAFTQFQPNSLTRAALHNVLGAKGGNVKQVGLVAHEIGLPKSMAYESAKSYKKNSDLNYEKRVASGAPRFSRLELKQMIEQEAGADMRESVTQSVFSDENL